MQVRYTLEECESYSCAFDLIANSDVSATAYIILSGIEPNEGAIITKDRFGIANIDELNNEKWYLL